MEQFSLFYDYLTSLLEKDPSKFDYKKHVYIELLNDIKSLEKYYKSILDTQKWMHEEYFVEKNSEVETNKSDSKINNIFINSKQPYNSQLVKLIKLHFQKNKAVIESKNKLLNVLIETDLSQRLLQRKSVKEFEQAKHKYNEVVNVLDSSTDVNNQLNSLNTINNEKVGAISAHMQLMEDKFENTIADTQKCVKEFNKIIIEMSKEILLDFPFNNDREYMHQNKKEHIPNTVFSLLIVCNELEMIFNSFKYMDQTKPLTKLSQNKSLFDVNWIDFLATYNFSKEKFTIDINQKDNFITIVDTHLNNLINNQQTFNTNLRKMSNVFNNARNEQNKKSDIINKLNDELDELKINKKSVIMSVENSNHLKDECINCINHLDNKIKNSKSKLIFMTEENNKIHEDLLHLDSQFNTISQTYAKYQNDLNKILLNENQWDKIMHSFKSIEDEHNNLLVEREKIILDKFNSKKCALEIAVKEKSQNIVKTRSMVMNFENKIKRNNKYTVQLKDLNQLMENAVNDLLLIYHNIVAQNYGKKLEYLEEEEIEYTNNINVCNKELEELKNIYENDENNSNRIVLKLNTEINNYNKKFQYVISANESLKTEIDKNKTRINHT